MEQLYCFNVKSSDKLYNTFVTKKVQNIEKDSEQISLKIGKLIGTSKSGDNFKYDAKLDLKDVLNNGKSSSKQIQLSEEYCTFNSGSGDR